MPKRVVWFTKNAHKRTLSLWKRIRSATVRRTFIECVGAANKEPRTGPEPMLVERQDDSTL